MIEKEHKHSSANPSPFTCYFLYMTSLSSCTQEISYMTVKFSFFFFEAIKDRRAACFDIIHRTHAVVIISRTNTIVNGLLMVFFGGIGVRILVQQM